MSLQSPHHPASTADGRPSGWSIVALAAAVLVWVGGVGLHVLGVVGPAVAVLGVVAGTVASARERRGAWRAAAPLAGLACLAAATIYALVLTSTITWPPSRW